MDESTPLTGPPVQTSPMYAFPSGVASRSRHQKKLRFQWFMGFAVLGIIIGALVITLILSGIMDEKTPPLILLTAIANTTMTMPTETYTQQNDTIIREKLQSIKKPIPDEPETEWALKYAHLNNSEGQQAVSAGIKALGDRELLEEGMTSTPVNTPAFRHYRSLSTNPEARKLARRGYVENQATMRIADMFNYTKVPGRSNIGKGPMIFLPPTPADNYTCDFNSIYREANGVCNNRQHPRLYGAAMIPYRRMVAPDYADGITKPRNSNSKARSLPSAREVSLRIHRACYETDSNFTVMLAVFGQFLDHDITATSLTASQEGESINCCTMSETPHPECFPVKVDQNDPYYSHFNVTCMNFVRSAPAPTGYFGPRQQLNQATAFIDSSVVYGNNEVRQRHLRTMSNGTLRMYLTDDGRDLLPLSTNIYDGCNRVKMSRKGRYCFESGDDRANENLLLTSMHLLWARQHNYLANGLQRFNPKWSDETIYQESRKILGAQMQHITYNEFLPILLGREMAGKKGLLPKSISSDTYNPKVDPSMANCFASAAFRFAHTLLPGLLNLTSDNTTEGSMELHRMLFNPFSLWEERGIDQALIVAANTPVQRVDRFFSPEVTQKLFEGTAEDRQPICGLDLVSLNIQRGRDHGLPAYPVFRRHCGLPPTDTWEQMSNAIDPDSLRSIREIYNSPEDVDVYTGALSEAPLKDGIFGPLLTCLVSDQFLRLKMGDSFWYERTRGSQSFSKEQLQEIYKTTLSEIICRNSDSIQRIRRHVMERREDNENPYINCNDMISFNFTAWMEIQPQFQLHRAKFSRADTAVHVMKAIVNLKTPTNNSHEFHH